MTVESATREDKRGYGCLHNISETLLYDTKGCSNANSTTTVLALLYLCYSGRLVHANTDASDGGFSVLPVRVLMTVLEV